MEKGRREAMKLRSGRDALFIPKIIPEKDGIMLHEAEK